MDQPVNKKELQIELPPEEAGGRYANLAAIAHGSDEFYIDFIAMAPNLPKARVQSRIVMTPQNAKNLLAALADNVRNYEAVFGTIQPHMPKNMPSAATTPDGIPNPFMGNA